MPAATDSETGRAFLLCKEHMVGWQAMHEADFACVPVTGGLTNLLFKCTNQASGAHPRHVLLRLYAANIEDMCPRVQDVTVFAILSERRVAPRLFGVFTAGRLEGFLDGKALLTAQLPDPLLSARIARGLARFHMEVMPLRCTPDWCTRTLHSMLRSARGMREAATAIDAPRADAIFRRNLASAVAEMEALFAACAPDIVFAHNDLQEGNIMLTDTDELHFIDFEYVSYNYSAYDVANHFAEWTYNYTNPDVPNFWHRPHDYPTDEQQKRFLIPYLTTRGKATDDATIAAMQADVQRFTLAVHFIWALWGVMNCASPIPFAYLEFAESRFHAYDTQRALVKEKYWPGPHVAILD